MKKLLLYILLLATSLFIAGCNNSQKVCSDLGYKGVVLSNTNFTPTRHCSDGLIQGDYYITNDGLYSIDDNSYFILASP